MPPKIQIDAWKTCNIGSCHRHNQCMYDPCRSIPVPPDPLRAALQEIIAITTQSHRSMPDPERPYTALSLIDGIARVALRHE